MRYITWCQLLPPPKLEDGPIEERDGNEHVPGGQVVHCSEGAPKWSLEPKPSRARGCVEIRHIIPGKNHCKGLGRKTPEKLLFASTE